MSNHFNQEFDWSEEVQRAEAEINTIVSTYNPGSGIFWRCLEHALFRLAEAVEERVRGAWFTENTENARESTQANLEAITALFGAVSDGRITLHPPEQEGV